MSKFSKFRKANPEIAGLLKRLLLAALFGVSGEERARLIADVNEIDSDGDGIPDSVDDTPQGDAKPAKKAAKKAAR